VTDGIDYMFRVKHFINFIKTNIIIFITGVIIKFLLKKKLIRYLIPFFLSGLKRLE